MKIAETKPKLSIIKNPERFLNFFDGKRVKAEGIIEREERSRVQSKIRVETNIDL